MSVRSTDGIQLWSDQEYPDPKIIGSDTSLYTDSRINEPVQRPLRRLEDGQGYAWPQEVMRRKDTTVRQKIKVEKSHILGQESSFATVVLDYQCDTLLDRSRLIEGLLPNDIATLSSHTLRGETLLNGPVLPFRRANKIDLHESVRKRSRHENWEIENKTPTHINSIASF